MLFLEETEPKNYTSCLKDDRFLVSVIKKLVSISDHLQDFFFENLRENKTGQHDSEYGYVSPCWGEANFVKVFGAPIVFRLMDYDDESGEYLMKYAGTQQEKFDPEKLFIDEDGLLLHEITSHEHLNIGSFDTNLACELAENLIESTDDRGNQAHAFVWNDKTYELR